MPRPRRRRVYRRKRAQPSRNLISAVNKVMARKNELKDITSTLSDQAANSTSGIQVVKLPPPSQGDGSSNRDGDSLYLKSVQLNAQLNCGSTASASETNIQRVILFQWMEDDTSCTPSGTDILQYGSNVAIPWAFYKTNPNRKFRIVFDKVVSFDANNLNAKRAIHINVNKIPVKKMSFADAATTGIAQFYLLTAGQQATGSLEQIQYRMRYYDN